MGDFNYVPLFHQGMNEITDGLEIHLPEYCARNCSGNYKCQEYYQELLSKPDGNYRCPFGFASKIFTNDDEKRYIFTAMRLVGTYSPKLADPKVHSGNRKISEREVESYVKLFLEFQEKTEAYDKLSGFVEDIFHDIRRFNGQLKGKSTKLYNKANQAKKNAQFVELAQSIQAICAFMTLRLNAFDFMYSEVPLAATEKISYNMYKIFDKVRHCLSERAIDRRIKIDITCNGVCGDIKAYDCIELLPYILLDNGIKYSDKGSTIEVNIQDSIQRCRFYVSSQSPALKNGEKEKIFQRGYRGENAKKMTSEGLGIGLYTAKKICDIHNAKINVYEEYNSLKNVNNFVVDVQFDK